MIRITATGADRRARVPDRGAPMLWALTAAERELLVKWVGTGTGDSRRVAALRKLAGAARLDAAERLLERLLLAGWIAVDERRENGFWVPYTLRWLDLPALQTALGLRRVPIATRRARLWTQGSRRWWRAQTEMSKPRRGNCWSSSRPCTMPCAINAPNWWRP